MEIYIIFVNVTSFGIKINSTSVKKQQSNKIKEIEIVKMKWFDI